MTQNEKTPERRAARRKHYQENKDYYFRKSEEYKDRAQAFVNALKDNPCLDCEIKYPHYVMDFDHREDEEKVRNIAEMVRRSGRKKLEEEIAKCDLVCANCHRERTWQRGHRNVCNTERSALASGFAIDDSRNVLTPETGLSSLQIT